MKAVAAMLLGLAGILIAFSAGIAANSEDLVTSTATLEMQQEAQRLMIQFCIVVLGLGCFFLYRGAVLLDRALYQLEVEELHRREVAG